MRPSDMTITVELTDKAQLRLDAMLAEIEGIRLEMQNCNELRRALKLAEEKLGALNATCAWQGHELLRLQRDRDEAKSMMRYAQEQAEAQMKRAQLAEESLAAIDRNPRPGPYAYEPAPWA